MKSILWTYILLVSSLGSAIAQAEYIGLAQQKITDLDINYGIIAVGTDGNGVHWQYAGSATEEDWMTVALDRNVEAVYPHKSGPIGWAISAGVVTPDDKPPYVYCSFTGEAFKANSNGIDQPTLSGVTDLDGFPDPSICGETYAVTGRILYRRFYGDTVWAPVFTATIEGHLEAVKVHRDYPGVVLLGGADGFAGTLLARSLDFGDTWEDISPPGMTLGLDFTGATADTIFAAASDKIFRTTDGGSTWMIVYQDGISFSLTEVLYDLAQNVVYAAGRSLPEDRGLMVRSLDLGNSWEQVPLGDLGAIKGLESASDGAIYFATRDDGVFRLEDIASGVASWQQDKQLISLTSISPNPSTGYGRIAYELTAFSQVTIDVRDARGIRVEQLLSDKKPAGSYTLDWEAPDLSAGVYFITLSSMGQRQARKLIISD